MAKKDHRHNKSVCETSMMLVANIISLSSVRFAGQCFATNLTPQGPVRTKKPHTYLTEPEEAGPTFVRQEINEVNVDISAEKYISHVRGKIEKEANTAGATKLFSSAAIPSSTSSSK